MNIFSPPNPQLTYESGIFTPTVIGGTTPGVGTYDIQIGRFVKIGELVHAFVGLRWSAHTGTGQLIFSGLPFASTSSVANGCATIGRHSNIALTANNILFIVCQAGTSNLLTRQTPVGGGIEASVPMDPAGDINFSIVYLTAI